MTTGYKNNAKSRFGVPGLPSARDGNSSTGDLSIPSVGLEDVDLALFKLFDVEMGLQVNMEKDGLKSVPVIFAAGEKWAQMKKSRVHRDRNGTLIIPLITVGRSTIEQNVTVDVTGRGINQQSGEIVISRRLDSTDRGYQSLINRLSLRNQANVVDPEGLNNELTTSRETGDLENDVTVIDGGLLLPDRRNNVYETISIPSPIFYTSTYEVIVWTQYIQHMNQLLEQIMASQLPQGNSWKLDTPQGYWFIAKTEDNIYNSESNFEDTSQVERIVKYKFTIKVAGYILATNTPGAPVPVKRYVSSPSISFDVGANEELASTSVDDPFLGADDPTLPLEDGKSRRRDQRNTTGTRLYPNVNEVNPEDPALQSLPRGQVPAKFKKIVSVDRNGKRTVKFIKVVKTNKSTGETIFAPGTDLGGLSIVIED